MKKEDIEFLRELQHELNTQDNECNANPVFWGIMESMEEPSPEGYDSYPNIYLNDWGYTLEEFVEELEQEYIEPDSDNALEWADISHECAEDVVEFANDVLNLGAEMVWVREVERLTTQTGAFLTKRAAQQYVERNSHNHRKAHTYSMTAYRNFELERLLNILKSMNVDDIKKDLT